MKVKVELQAYLEQYSPNGNDLFDYEVPDGARVLDLVTKLGIPGDLASIIIVSDQNTDPSYALKEGDRVILIPPLAGGSRVAQFRVWPAVLRIATIGGVIGGLLFLLLLVVSIGFTMLAISGGVRGGGGSSIDHEPMSLETAQELIDSGGIYMVAIRKEGNMDEYFLLDEGLEYDPHAEPSRTWKVDGVDVHVFTDSMPTGTPVASGDEDEVGITSDQLIDLLQRVERFNAASSWQIQVLDQREQ